MSQDVKDLLNFLKKNLKNVSPPVQKCMSTLGRTNDLKKVMVNVYSIFHHITLTLTEEKESMEVTVKICSKCLSFLVSNWHPGNSIPKNGIEKLVFLILKHILPRPLQDVIDDLCEITHNVLRLVQRQENTDVQVLAHLAGKITRLASPEKQCGCHQPSSCFHIKLFECKLLGHILALCGEMLSAENFFVKNVMFMDSTTKENCPCHIHAASQIVQSSIPQFQDCFSISQKERKFIVSSNALLVTFSQIRCLLSNDPSRCKPSGEINLPDTLKDFCLNLQGLNRTFEGFHSTPDQAVSYKIICKMVVDVLNQLANFVATPSKLDWLTLLPILDDLFQQNLLMKNEALTNDVLMKAIFLYAKIFETRPDKDAKTLALRQCVKEIQKSLPTYCVKGKHHVEYVVDVVINMCILAVKQVDNEQLEAAVSLAIYAVEILKECRIGNKRQWQNSSSLTCRLLRKLHRCEEAMTWCGQVMAFPLLKHEERQHMVSLWVCCKIDLISEARPERNAQSLTTADYFPVTADPSIVVDTLLLELDVYMNSKQHPPVSEFHALCKILELGVAGTSPYLTANALLAYMLRSWPGEELFQYSRSALELSSSYKSYRNSDVCWEISFIIHFTYYMCLYENTLKRIWEEKKNFSPSDEVSHSLQWFPCLPPPDRESLLYMVDILEDASNHHSNPLQFKEEVIQAYRVLINLLNLFNEEALLLRSLTCKEKILRFEIQRDHHQFDIWINLIMTKCYLSKLFCRLQQPEQSLQHIKEALDAYSDLADETLKEKAERRQKVMEKLAVEMRSMFAWCLAQNCKFSEAHEVISDVMNHDFISVNRKKSSRTSAFGAARIDLLLSELLPSLTHQQQLPLDGAHATNNAVSSTVTCCVVLEQLCPGLSKVISNSFETPHSSEWVPSFGKKTKDSIDDIVFQFDVIEHLLSSFYRTADSWLLAGEVRVAPIYILDGLALSRALCLPERELQFQLLIVKHAIIERNLIKVKSDLQVVKDVLKYIHGLETYPKRLKRIKLYSGPSITSSAEIDSETEGALNNSSIMEDNEDYEKDLICRAAHAPKDMSAVVDVIERDVMSSPKFKAKAKFSKLKQPAVFAHPAGCQCRLCTNVFLIKDQCLLSQLYAEYSELKGNSLGAISYLEKTRKFIHSYLNVKKELKPNNRGDASIKNKVFFTQEIEILSSMARIHLHFEEINPAKACAAQGLALICQQPASTQDLRVYAWLHLLAGQMLLTMPTKPVLNGLSCLDSMIDCLAKMNAEKIGRAEFSQGLSDKLKKMKLNSSVPDEKPLIIKNTKTLCGEKSVDKTTYTRKTSTKAEKTPRGEKLVAKTPQSKRAVQPRTPGRSNKKTTSKESEKSSGNFTIFDEEGAVDIKLTSTESKLTTSKIPLPEIGFEADGGVAVTTKKKKSRRVVFNCSLDEDDDNLSTCDDATVELPKPSLNKTPARGTRFSRRIAVKNVMSSRRDARKKHREEEGPVYTEDDPEESRPSRRYTRKSKAKVVAGDTEDQTELEEMRDLKEMDLASSHSLPPLYIEPESIVSPESEMEYKLDDYKCDHYFNEAFQAATAAGDFHVSKLSCQYLALYHNCHSTSAVPSLPSTSHAFSIGITLRTSSHINMRACLKNITRTRKKEPQQGLGSNQQCYVKAVQDMLERTQPRHAISSMRDHEGHMTTVCSKLPPDWTICIVSSLQRGKVSQLMVTRLRREESPLHLQTQDAPVPAMLRKLEHLLECNIKGMQTTNKSLWWTQRKAANKAMDNFVKEFEHKLFGCHRGVLLGSPLEKDCKKELNRCSLLVTNAINKAFPTSQISSDMVEIFLQIWKDLSPKDKCDVILLLLNSVSCRPSEAQLTEIVRDFEQFSDHLDNHSCKRGHVVLILDKDLQALPVESMRTLHEHSVSRMPSLDLLLWQLSLRSIDSHCQADLRKTSYVVNPKGDLMKTEDRFADWLKSIPSWSGVISRYPTKEQWLSYLTDSDLFLFCGHGSGSNFMNRELIARRRSCACALLMGCSSGKLTERGITEPDGTAVSYMVSGSPCVLSCLWQVTDKDIDRYLVKCLIEWTKESSLADVIRGAEVACKLPRLNGSACVLYGLPVLCAQSEGQMIDSLPQHFKDLL